MLIIFHFHYFAILCIGAILRLALYTERLSHRKKIKYCFEC